MLEAAQKLFLWGFGILIKKTSVQWVFIYQEYITWTNFNPDMDK